MSLSLKGDSGAQAIGIYRSVLWMEGGITLFTLSRVNPTSCKALTTTHSPLCPQHSEEKIGRERVRKLMGQGKGLQCQKGEERIGEDSEKASPMVFKFSGCWLL